MQQISDKEDLLDDVNWANFWLHTPENQLPGALTHERCKFVLESAIEQLARHFPDAVPTLPQTYI